MRELRCIAHYRHIVYTCLLSLSDESHQPASVLFQKATFMTDSAKSIIRKLCVTLVACAAVAPHVIAQDGKSTEVVDTEATKNSETDTVTPNKEAPGTDDTGSDPMLEEMLRRKQDTKVRVINRNGNEIVAVLHPKPVFRYSDQPRFFYDATLWVWTVDGLPVAMQKNVFDNWMFFFADRKILTSDEQKARQK